MTEHLLPAEQPVTEDDEFIGRALESASIPALMMSMIHMSGDASCLKGSLRPRTATLGEAGGGFSEQEKREIRQAALDVIRAYRDSGCRLPPPPRPETIQEMMSFIVGEEVPVDYVPMMLEEMALDGRDSRVVEIDERVGDEARRDFGVLVIGAGMSGLLAAIRLEEAGIAYTVVEKNPAIGGTWYENTYPGCRVDVANHFYSYSFEPNHDWSELYSRQQELQAYFDRCSVKYGVRDHIRFETEVLAACYDEGRGRWGVTLRHADGIEESVEVSAIVSAVGQLNRPFIPEFEGLDQFEGPAFHSACWQHEHDLRGKRVAVIGTGASALQLVPEVAKQAGRLQVFQRSPVWMFPNPHYHREVSEGMRWLLKHLPYYARWYRFLVFWPGSDGLMPSLIVDPEWPHQDQSINAMNHAMREIFTEYMKSQIGDDEELLAKVVPPYPPFCKRMLQDNGSWLATLKRDDVDLVTEPISRVEANALVTADGERHEADVIVFATGFQTDRFLWPMQIVGRGGAELAQVWGEEPRAHLGITVPGFPNLFCLYGPGTNLAHAGSIIFHSECQVRYVMGCLKLLLEEGHAAMECRRESFDAYNQRLEEALARTVWAHPGVDSWYKNRDGKVICTSPWLLLDYWRWTRVPDPADFVFFDAVGSTRTAV